MSHTPDPQSFYEEGDNNELALRIFIVTSNNEEADPNRVDHLKDLDMQEIMSEIQKDPEYIKIMEAMRVGLNSKELHDSHPAKEWASSLA